MSAPLVAIGASAGGLEALFELFSALPADTGAAFVVIQHLDRDHKSLLADLLGKKTRMPVREIEDGAALAANEVFVIPPNTSLKITDDRLLLAPRDTSGAPHHPVDVFFSSMAEARETSAIGVVLSGGDSDGTLGVKAIKGRGGITFAQTPSSTKFSGMPQHAIDTGCVDYVLAPAGIAREIGRLVRHPYLSIAQPAEQDLETATEPATESDERALRRVFRRLRTAHGVDFSNYKRSTLRRRLARRLALSRTDNIGTYVDALEEDLAETHALYQDFLIQVTHFFRDPQLFEGLYLHVFPVICDQRNPEEPIRIWIAGCATGEEVYSIAIALVEYLGEDASSRRILIFGTDVSESAIETARVGSYPDNITAEVSSERLARYFTRENGRFRVVNRIRDLCIFARHDVTRDPPFSRIDLLSCRNLLIYLDNNAQRRIMRSFHYALSLRGFLALGLSESVGEASERFELIDKRHRIYTRKGAASTRLDGIETSHKDITQMRLLETEDPTLSSDADFINREADRVLIGRYAPASLLVDEALNILQFRGETGPYVEHASGAPSVNLTRVIRPELLVEVAPAIQEARDIGLPVWRRELSLGDKTDVRVGVFPLRTVSSERSFLIVFESAQMETARRAREVLLPQLTDSEKDGRIALLERELAATRDYLQTTMEEQEAVREDLKSAHEEVLSANEEFQSTNEELETAKEELQSTNEELTTTNEELLNRNRDLTLLNIELQRTQQIAVRAQSYADAIIASARDPLLVLDRDLRVLRANETFYRQFDLRRETTEGRTLRDLDGRQWDLPTLLLNLARVVTKNEVLSDYEIKYRATSASVPLTLRVDARMISGDSERDELLLVAMEDVTHRRAHDDLMALMNQRKDEFLAMLAHELRNPLTPIAHAVHLLQTEDFAGSPLALHTMIARQTRRLMRLVDDLLDLARINRGHIELRTKAVDLATVVRDAAASVYSRIQEKGHTLTVSVPDSAVCVQGDAVRLEQIISNLFENAAKYTDPGGRIDVALTEQNGEAVLSVHDNGIGLAPESLKDIFDLFNQVDSTLSRTRGGLGIGLTLVRRVLDLHGGTVEAHSTGVGHGSDFIVRLPIAEKKAQAAIDVASDEAAGPTPRRRILMVDDNADALQSLQLLAEHWGHEVAIAHDGPEALALAETFDPEIALVDIGLPGMDGYAVATRLRARSRELFLIAMTGYGRAEDIALAKSAGFDEHLVKPADIDELEGLLARGRAPADSG